MDIKDKLARLDVIETVGMRRIRERLMAEAIEYWDRGDRPDSCSFECYCARYVAQRLIRIARDN